MKLNKYEYKENDLAVIGKGANFNNHLRSTINFYSNTQWFRYLFSHEEYLHLVNRNKVFISATGIQLEFYIPCLT